MLSLRWSVSYQLAEVNGVLYGSRFCYGLAGVIMLFQGSDLSVNTVVASMSTHKCISYMVSILWTWLSLFQEPCPSGRSEILTIAQAFRQSPKVGSRSLWYGFHCFQYGLVNVMLTFLGTLETSVDTVAASTYARWLI